MTFPDPATVLRHRGPAVLVRSVVEFSGERLVCSSSDGGVWPWPRLLEGAAQTAGLLAGAQTDGLASKRTRGEPSKGEGRWACWCPRPC